MPYEELELWEAETRESDERLVLRRASGPPKRPWEVL
jgi:hypothetical protein